VGRSETSISCPGASDHGVAPGAQRSRASPPWLDVAARWSGSGWRAIWLASGWLKAIDPDQTTSRVRLQRDARPAVAAVAAVLPYLELALGLLVLWDGTRLVAVLSACCSWSSSRALAQGWARGLSIGLRLLRGRGDVAPDRPATVLSCCGTPGPRPRGLVIIRPRTLFALDDVLTSGERQSVAEEVPDRRPEPAVVRSSTYVGRRVVGSPC